MPPRTRKTPTAPPVEKPVEKPILKVGDKVHYGRDTREWMIRQIEGTVADLVCDLHQKRIGVDYLRLAYTVTPTPAEPTKSPSPVSTPPAKPAERVCGWRWRHVSETFGVFSITNGVTTEYFYERCSAVLHTVTKLERARKTTYNVYISKTVQECGCQAFKPGKRCKHIECLVTLLELNI